MKKILLIIVLIIAIFQMVTLATDIYIGASAINRATSLSDNTIINNNSANLSGKITSVEIWSFSNLTNCEVAIFYKPDPAGFPNNFTTRDSVAIGAVTSGAKRTFAVNLNVQIGDYIGIYYTAGDIEADNAGCNGIWVKSGDNIPCTNVTFTGYSTFAISLYGNGTTIIGWGHKWNTKEISKWNTKEFTKWNDLE